MPTYSFMDVNAGMTGPGGAVNLGAGAGADDGGITIDPTEDINTLTVGADGIGMHSLHANKSGSVTVRLLKTSPVNRVLSQMYAFQTASAANHGQNTISVTNANTQDVITCQRCAFKRAPTITYAKEGGMMEWTFAAAQIDRTLGSVA